MSDKNIVKKKITETLEENYMPYAMSSILSRAIPQIDGFKPSHRKLLYTMYKMNLLKGSKTKSANIVGQTMKLNPHGDMAIYETMVRLTSGNEALLHPLVESKGNFGKYFSRDMRFAAPRYTEAKLADICQEVFRDIDKDTVDFVDNYDGTLKEPTLLPTTFPNILANPNQGIAVGMACNICSFNLRELCDATVALMEDESANLLKIIDAPDFSSGGQIIYNESTLKHIFKTGTGSFKLRAKYKFDPKNNCIEIFEIPYTTTTEAIIDKIIELVKSNKIKDITDVRDETDLKGLKLTIDIKKGTDPDDLMNKLFKTTPLEDTFSCNFNVLIDGRPRTVGVRELLIEWIRFRIGSIKRQLLFDIQKKEEKLHLLKGLQKILLDIDKAIHIIRNTEEEKKVLPNLMEGFAIDDVQAEYIAEIKLRYLNKEYILKRIEEIAALEKDIKDLNETFNSEKKVKKLIESQLQDVKKKYGTDRKTEIIHEHHIEEITEEHFIEDYNLRLFLTKHNYLKKISLVSLRGASDHKIKANDSIIQEIETHNKAELLLFSNKQAVYKQKIYEINDCKASEFGEYLPNILNLDEDEEIIYIVATDDYSGHMLFAYDDGRIGKIPLSSYETKTNRKKLANAYADKARLVYIVFLSENRELVAYSSINKVLIFNTEMINEKTTRHSQGIMVMKSKKGSKMLQVKPIEEIELSDPDYYRVKNIPAIGYYLKEEDESKGKNKKVFSRNPLIK